MTSTISVLMAVSFLIGIVGLMALVWAISANQFRSMSHGARLIFDHPNQVEDPTANETMLQQSVHNETHISDVGSRMRADLSTQKPVLLFGISAVFWLLFGSVFGLMASIKLHAPDWLNSSSWLTFGIVRTLHLNAVAYGWLSMGGVAICLWLLPRLLKVELKGNQYAVFGSVLWNIGLMLGLFAIANGQTDGMEWLEIPWYIDIFFVLAGGCVGIPLIQTFQHRKVEHLYVSAWYIIAALVWFPFLFFIANIPGLHFGVEQALVNWWYAHNALGLWFTPISLAAAYYLIPKIIGKPIYSYQLSLLGFWSLGLFYSQVGVHHLIGGPVPTWVATLSIVTSVSMVIPVLAVAVNHHFTAFKHLKALKHSPVLRFIVTGAMMYTAASFQGSMESLRSVNTVTHFTHYTVAHAHLGAYGFASIITFGTLYFALPRVTCQEWPHPKLISAHYWFIVAGFVIYFVSLTIGGWFQGQAMLNADIAFSESVTLTKPYLLGRTFGGVLMTIGHFIFGYHVFVLVKRCSQAMKALSPTASTNTTVESAQ